MILWLGQYYEIVDTIGLVIMAHIYLHCWGFITKKNIEWLLNIITIVFTCSFKKMIKIDVLDFVSQFFKTKTPKIKFF